MIKENSVRFKAKQYITDNFENHDEDKDGRLNYKELEAMHNAFKESRAYKNRERP